MKFKYKFLRLNKGFLYGLSGIAAVISIWFFITQFNFINPVFLSSPRETLKELVFLFSSGLIYKDILISLSEFIVGFFLALIFGVVFGYLFGWKKSVNSTFKPLIYALNATPVIAIFPLIIVWFGIEYWSKVILIFLAIYFPVLIATSDAVRNVDSSYLKLAKSFSASDWQILKSIIIPSSIPNIISGVKIAIPRGFVGMVMAEYFTGNIGVGYLIAYYGATFQTARLLAVVILILFASISLAIIVDFLEKKTQSWKL